MRMTPSPWQFSHLSAFNVEAEATFFVAAGFGFFGGSEYSADFIEKFGVGGRVASWGSSDGVLVDDYDVAYDFWDFESAVFADFVHLFTEHLLQRGDNGEVHQGAFA